MILILLTLTAIAALICIKKIKNYEPSIHNNKYIVKQPSNTTNYEIMVVSDDILNKFVDKRVLYIVTEAKSMFDFAVFVNVGSTMILTAKLEYVNTYNSLEDIKLSTNIDIIDYGPILSKYCLCKYNLTNADINRTIVNGVFHHYIIDHDLLVSENN
jgi:hypothetical protein